MGMTHVNTNQAKIYEITWNCQKYEKYPKMHWIVCVQAICDKLNQFQWHPSTSVTCWPQEIIAKMNEMNTVGAYLK